MKKRFLCGMIISAVTITFVSCIASKERKREPVKKVEASPFSFDVNSKTFEVFIE